METAIVNTYLELDSLDFENLLDPDFIPAKVVCFKNDLVREIFEYCEPLEGVILDVHNYPPEWINTVNYNPHQVDTDGTGTGLPSDNAVGPNNCEYFWPASVIQAKGCYVLLRFEREREGDGSHDFWCHLISTRNKPFGLSRYSSSNSFSLTPRSTRGPRKKGIMPAHCQAGPGFFRQPKYINPRTLPPNLDRLFQNSLKCTSCRSLLNPERNAIDFQPGGGVEVRGRFNLDKYYLGTITLIQGNRLQVTYRNGKFSKKWKSRKMSAKGIYKFSVVWCDKDSESVQPYGWCKTVGHTLRGGSREMSSSDPLPLDIAGSEYESINYEGVDVGQLLEVIYPLQRDTIRVAIVEKVLRYGYVMVRVEGEWEFDRPKSATLFCVHLSSSEVFPFGFAHKYDLPFAKPFTYNGDWDFDWEHQGPELRKLAVPRELFQRTLDFYYPYARSFVENTRVEATDWVTPRNILPATIVRVVNAPKEKRQLLQVQYDEKGSKFEQWVESSSCDIYPVGYCKLVRHPFRSAESTCLTAGLPKLRSPLHPVKSSMETIVEEELFDFDSGAEQAKVDDDLDALLSTCTKWQCKIKWPYAPP